MNSTVTYLQRFLETSTGDALSHECVTAKLYAVTGDIAAASSALDKLLRTHGDRLQDNDFLFTYVIQIALLSFQLDAAAGVINRRYNTQDWFRIRYDRRDPAWITAVGLRVSANASAVFSISDELRTSDRFDFVINRWIGVLPLFAEYYRRQGRDSGDIQVNLEDHGVVPGLAFCDNRPEYFLVPDTPYLTSRGYTKIREHFAAHNVEWQQRKPVAFWRGSTSGRMADPAVGWRSLPRVTLCQIAQSHRGLINAGISQVAQMPNAEAEEEVKASGLLSDFVPPEDLNKYRYQIDIDGNTNSWPGLFQKLLTGSPVLKVASRDGFRQWYYDRLKPWVNFVPVATDMSDLVEKVQWLTVHDNTARAIGRNGCLLAESLDYAGELERAVPVIGAALRYFSGQPEAVVRFAPGQKENGASHSGLPETENGGAAPEGFETRFKLARPIVNEDFVLTLEISPIVGPSLPVAQRLCVIANGEILRQASLTARTELDCFLPRRLISQSDELTITLLHPDAVYSASAARPLDARTLSIVLHHLKLTAASLHRAVTTEPPIADGAPTRPTRQGAIMHALYGRDVWQGFVQSRPRAREIQGWNGRHPVFARLLDEVQNKTVVDVAVWKGQSTIFVAELMRERRLDGCIIAVDTFLAEEHWPADGKLFGRHPGGRPDVYETFLANVVYAGVAELIVPLSASSTAAARLLAQRGIKAGLIHLDVSRDYTELLRDAQAYWQLVDPGGYLVGDDYGPSWPGVIRAAKEFAASVGSNLDVDGVKWFVRKPTVHASQDR